MTPNEQLLCFIAAGTEPVDPIRIMKGLFLFNRAVKSGALPSLDTFAFSPMDYGPCAPAIYDELDALVARGSIEAIEAAGQTWCRYEATESGADEVARIQHGALRQTTDFLRQLREWCDGQSFASLLKAIYEAHPDYAVNSVFKH